MAMKKQNNKEEGVFSIIAALIVLFSAMWDPWISIIVSIAALVGFGLYKFLKK